jgi:heme/copper-type cytochrome/quinol oxidase subunit 3
MSEDEPVLPYPGHTASGRRTPLVPNGVMGMLLFTITELMFFTGLVSAFLVAEASSLGINWPPPDQPRLPAAQTAWNTAALLLSAVFLFFAERRFRKNPDDAKTLTTIALALGALFVILQGREWAALLAQGMTLSSSQLASFFYLMIGCHGAHAVVAVGLLADATRRLRSGSLTPGHFWTVQVFWYFVVGVWPFLYFVVYL